MMHVDDLELSGSDYFLCAMSRITRNAGCLDGQCRIVVELDGKINSDEFYDFVNSAPLLRWMVNVQKKNRFPFTLPRWRSNGSGNHVPVTSCTGDEDHLGVNGKFLSFSPPRFQSKMHSPLSFSYANHDDDRATCVLNWDHTLMDAHGAELLLQHLACYPKKKGDVEGLIPSNGQNLVSRVPSSLSFPQRFSYARKSIRYISEASELPIAVMKSSSIPLEPKDQYFTVHFNEDETKKIVKQCEAIGLSYYHSLFYLAAATRAVHAVKAEKGEDFCPYLIPVPLNLRRKGGVGPAFSNNVSFLFYRVTPEEVADFRKTVVSLKKQMKDQVSQEIPHSYAELMKILRHLPLPFYSWLLSGPTNGKLASFFFSYTGECCPDVDSFMGQQVREITHLAPATSIPGLSVVFMRHRNCLKAILSFRDSLYQKEDLKLFERQLRKDLLSEDD